MSEAKRVTFTTISSMASTANSSSIGGGNFLAPNALPAAGAVRFGIDLFAEPKSDTPAPSPTDEERRKTVRLSLELSPTDKVTYPEINYARLMRLEEKKRKKLRQKINGASSSSVPFEENDDDVARIAAELEKKYGCAYGRGRGRHKRDDHCDIGMGYDESDSFIDNTDAYDENIPEEVETVEGGFYINCGALEFKQLNTETVKLKTDEIIKMPSKSRKRILSISSSSDDSSSSENEEITANNEKNDQNDSESSGSTTKSKNTNINSTKRLKKENAAAKKSSQHNGKKKEKTKNASSTISLSTSNSPKPSTVLDEPASDSSDKDRCAARPKAVKTTTIKDMLKAKRDSFLKMQVGGGEAAKSANGELRGVASKSSDDESSDSSKDDGASKSDTDSNHSANVPQSKSKADGKSEVTHNAGMESTENTEKLRSTDTKLPELEADVVTNIHSFKELVKSKNITGKRFQFDEELTELFLRIDETLLCIEKSHRNMVFAHLEYNLFLPKYFFLRKAKQLRIKMEKLKTQRALGKLRKAVIEAMPGVITNYEVEVRKYTELQSSNANTGNPPKMPKKKFPWNSNIRNLLYDVYQTRWISYPVLCTRKESLEDFITVYLKEKVVEIWPNGWMRFEELQKEIEKRKQANRKAKEKKAENQNNLPTTSSVSMSTTSISNVLTTATTATSSYAKQFEEFAGNRSGCNSDNDSVASSNTSNGSSLKRKAQNTEDSSNRNKAKVTKGSTNATAANSNGSLAAISEETANSNIAKNVVTISNSDCPTHPIQSQSTLVSAIAATNVTISNSLPQDSSKHSNFISSTKPTTAHVIDLDQYSSANDILEKSKQLQQASVNAPSSSPLENTVTLAPIVKRTNSSDSDGVEIVGVFQANENPAPAPATKARPKKQQQQQSQQNNSTKPTAICNNNNNKKLTTGLSNAFDVNTALSALKDLERSQQLKPKNTSIGVKESHQ